MTVTTKRINETVFDLDHNMKKFASEKKVAEFPSLIDQQRENVISVSSQGIIAIKN